MKKVLFVINTLGGAGAERALLELLKRFTPGISMRLICIYFWSRES